MGCRSSPAVQDSISTNRPPEHDFSAGTIAATTLRDLRDRALVAPLAYSFARITPALKIEAEDLRPAAPDGRSGCMRKAASAPR
jgi:hypothetical protein